MLMLALDAADALFTKVVQRLLCREQIRDVEAIFLCLEIFRAEFQREERAIDRVCGCSSS
jgi:hypothetical protein